MNAIEKIVADAAAHKEFLSDAPSDQLGVGKNPTLHDVCVRISVYKKSAAYLSGPCARKASRANTTKKKWRVYRQVRRHDSAAAYEILCEIRGIQ
jgi:hypothetical protein